MQNGITVRIRLTQMVSYCI